MNTNNLKTFNVLPFGAKDNTVGYFPSQENAEIPVTTLPYFPGAEAPTRSLLDGNLVKTVQVVDTDKGFPLEKANVFAKANPTRGGSTGANGEITIVAQSPTEIIVFQYQGNRIERVFNTLGSMINIDTKLTQPAVIVDATPQTPAQTDSKVNYLKWLGIGAAALVVLNMFSEDKPKKVTV